MIFFMIFSMQIIYSKSRLYENQQLKSEQGKVLLVSTPMIMFLKGSVHGSAHVHESKYFFAFARYDPSLFNLIRCL